MTVKLIIIFILCITSLGFLVFKNLSAVISVFCFVGFFNGQLCSTEQVVFSSYRSVPSVVIYAPHEMTLL